MRITLKRSGGFGGIQTTASLDLDTPSDAKAAEARRLIDAADFFNLPKTIRLQQQQPDRFQFELTIEDGQRSHTVSTSEDAASKELKTLVSWVQKNAK